MIIATHNFSVGMGHSLAAGMVMVTVADLAREAGDTLERVLSRDPIARHADPGDPGAIRTPERVDLRRPMHEEGEC